MLLVALVAFAVLIIGWMVLPEAPAVVDAEPMGMPAPRLVEAG
jgi:hypothetical protein